MMTTKETGECIKCLKLMLADLNDMHNDYDIPSGCEDSAREMLKESIAFFNKSQINWKCKLIPTKHGYKLKFE